MPCRIVVLNLHSFAERRPYFEGIPHCASLILSIVIILPDHN
jgi:hypothetical protein